MGFSIRTPTQLLCHQRCGKVLKSDFKKANFLQIFSKKHKVKVFKKKMNTIHSIQILVQFNPSIQFSIQKIQI